MTPSEAAVRGVERVGGRIDEADLRAALTERHGSRFARMAIEFAVLRGGLVRVPLGPVTMLHLADEGAR